MKRLLLFLVTGCAAAGFVMREAWAQTQKHPGAVQSDCSIPITTCTDWKSHVEIAGLSGYEDWREERFHTRGGGTISIHAVRVSKDNPYTFRGASVTVNGSDEKTSTTRVFTWGGHALSYDENCEKHESLQATSETHAFVIWKNSERAGGFSVNWEHTSRGDSITRYRIGSSGQTVRDDSVKDLTRCNDQNFPFAFLRAADLKPLESIQKP